MLPLRTTRAVLFLQGSKITDRRYVLAILGDRIEWTRYVNTAVVFVGRTAIRRAVDHVERVDKIRPLIQIV